MLSEANQAQKDKGHVVSSHTGEADTIWIQAILWKTGYVKGRSLTGEGE
jgi:hypothetical protein